MCEEEMMSPPPPPFTGPQPQTVDRTGGCLTYCAACSVCSPPASVFWRSACRTDTAEVTWLPPNPASREIQSDSKPHFPPEQAARANINNVSLRESFLCPHMTLEGCCCLMICWCSSACGGCWVPSYHVHKLIKWHSLLLLKLTGPFNNP